MAVNLTPQYHEAEQEYKRAQTAEERLECLKKMWALVPKHKASEKLQAELKFLDETSRKELSIAVDQLTVDAASKRWPQINFHGVKSVWLEPRAGVLKRFCDSS